MTMEHSTEVAPSHGSGVARHCVQQRASSLKVLTEKTRWPAGGQNAVIINMIHCIATRRMIIDLPSSRATRNAHISVVLLCRTQLCTGAKHRRTINTTFEPSVRTWIEEWRLPSCILLKRPDIKSSSL